MHPGDGKKFKDSVTKASTASTTTRHKLTVVMTDHYRRRW